MTRSVGARITRTDQQKAYAAQMGAEALERQRRAGASRCKSCRAPIRWGITSNGKRMPVDYDEHEGGNVFLFADGNCIVGTQDQPTPNAATRHYSHFVTCPNAGEHRR